MQTSTKTNNFNLTKKKFYFILTNNRCNSGRIKCISCANTMNSDRCVTAIREFSGKTKRLINKYENS